MGKFLYKYWSQILVSIVFVLGVFIFTFYLYPILIHNYVQSNVEYNHEDDKLGRGTFGDMYGALNTFFSGLAFIGLIVTIGVQIFLHESEKRTEEEKETNEEKRKLIYFANLVHKSNLFTLDTIQNLQDFYDNIQKNPNEIPRIKQSPMNEINIIVNKVDQESLFNAYVSQLNTDEVNEILAYFTVILVSYTDFIESLGESVKYDSERKLKCTQNINKWIDELRNVITVLINEKKDNTHEFSFLIKQLDLINIAVENNSSDIHQFDNILADVWDFVTVDDKCFLPQYRNLGEITTKTISSFPPIRISNNKVANQALELKNKLNDKLISLAPKQMALIKFKNKTVLK